MRALKILVYVMGVMLVVGTLVLAGTIIYRVKHRPAEATAAIPAVIPPNGMPRNVKLPTGAKVIATQSDGDRVMLRLMLADGGEQLMLVDWKTGAVLSSLNLK